MYVYESMYYLCANLGSSPSFCQLAPVAWSLSLSLSLSLSVCLCLSLCLSLRASLCVQVLKERLLREIEKNIAAIHSNYVSSSEMIKVRKKEPYVSITVYPLYALYTP